MTKYSIVENIGGFFINSHKHTQLILTEKELNWKRIYAQSMLFILVTALFGGCVFMFFVLYPEVYLIPGALHEGNHGIYSSANPSDILIIFFIGFSLIFFYDYLLQGILSYSFIRLFLNRNSDSHSVSYSKYMSLHSYPFIYTTIFHMITVVWIFFFEKYSGVKDWFPIADMTLPLIIQTIILFIFVALKWISEFRINSAILTLADVSKKTQIKFFLIWISIKIILASVLLYIAYLGGNMIARR